MWLISPLWTCRYPRHEASVQRLTAAAVARSLRAHGVSGPSWTRSYQKQRELANAASYLSDEDKVCTPGL